MAEVSGQDAPGRRWTAAEAAEWAAREPWLCGFNYLRRRAVNFVDQWQAAGFDPAGIGEELAWARDVGFNTLRTNLPWIVWQDDPAGMRDRLDRFLGIAYRNGLRVMLCLFDDCGFSGSEPRLGPQGDPVPGVHNSRAVASPGHAVVRDRTLWDGLERYVRDIVGHFRDDARIVVWDVYNEPGNDSVFAPAGTPTPSDRLLPHSLALAGEAVAWARSARPVQPLTIGIWHPGWEAANATFADLSDVVSFHNYLGLDAVRWQVERLRAYGRPLLCTEWLARSLGSRPSTHLPFFARERIGCYHWGLVNGRTQTHLPWPGLAIPGAEDVWHHDLFHEDGTPYDPDEIAVFRLLLHGQGGNAAAPASRIGS